MIFWFSPGARTADLSRSALLAKISWFASVGLHGARPADLFPFAYMAQDQLICIGPFHWPKIRWFAPWLTVHSARSADLLRFSSWRKISWFFTHLVLPEYQLILLLDSRSVYQRDRHRSFLWLNWWWLASFHWTVRRSHVWNLNHVFLKVLLLEIVDIATVSNRGQFFLLAYVWRPEHFQNATSYFRVGTTRCCELTLGKSSLHGWVW